MKKSILIIFISGITFAQSSEQTVNNLLDVTGIHLELQQLDAIFEAKIVEQKASFENTATFEKFATLMQSGFSSANAEKYFVEYITLKGNNDSLKEVITMYKNPLMQEMNKIELSANRPRCS